jgi:hypothetical protein
MEPIAPKMGDGNSQTGPPWLVMRRTADTAAPQEFF